MRSVDRSDRNHVDEQDTFSLGECKTDLERALTLALNARAEVRARRPAQNKIVWEANSSNVPLMNGFVAGIQRLPNGNAAMCSFPGELRVDPKTTRCFEVTPDFKIVWELKTPKDAFWTSLEFLDPATRVGGVALR
jgi:hypothetical protein